MYAYVAVAVLFYRAYYSSYVNTINVTAVSHRWNGILFVTAMYGSYDFFFR